MSTLQSERGEKRQRMTNTYSLTCELCGQVYQVNFRPSAFTGLCPLCWDKDRNRELDRILSARHQVQKKGWEASLTLADWLSIITYHGGRCAYCQQVPFSLINLFEPAQGLTASNAVPCCKACSVHKAHSFEAALARVAFQLSNNDYTRMDPGAARDCEVG